jgi:arylsulfatase A-like enzyme
LFPARAISTERDAAGREFLARLNARHLDEHAGEADLAARIRSHELAARMQVVVPEVANLAGEPEHVQKLYGLGEPETDDTGRRCLLARRLLERGVRFVQIYSGGPIAGTPRTSWDAHENVVENHSAEAKRIDRPVAALLEDLSRRGMLEDTLVLFTTEFGRTPFTQSAADKVGTGRDHNKYGFSCWLAGGGLKAGTAFGATDEIGWKAVEQPIPWHDFHATVLHAMGLDHEQLVFYHNGIRRRLTNVHGHVRTEWLG